MKDKVISKSSDGKMMQIVRITKHEGTKNRRGEVYKTSRTLHVPVKK